ncbi:MAG: bifunctional demethylmenaquinone methyltransferase/2-methoxy-6-polyprenyl-1,4-benzoquinol methylase UbiE [Legionellales bacterium]|nr:bifunctional demethylmenaquinone methyltransferase/2-methoxy-6-polyprenyl-1,4-benzoquinol methylase UbiE [Legionellales bacterium]
MPTRPTKTDFGFRQVLPHEKTQKVAEVFHSVADDYDIMNDLMSLGLHRLWKKICIEFAKPRPGQCILDLAGGTGDLAQQFVKRTQPGGHVCLTDINAAMLAKGKQRLLNQGIVRGVNYIQADAEHLPFANHTFHTITIGFGLRNVTDKLAALKSMWRVLKPGGQLLVLEFSKPTVPMLQPLYDWYSFAMLPWLGQQIANDAASYRYLAESIRMHPDQRQLAALIEQAGFMDCRYNNLTMGIVALHRAYKY